MPYEGSELEQRLTRLSCYVTEVAPPECLNLMLCPRGSYSSAKNFVANVGIMCMGYYRVHYKLADSFFAFVLNASSGRRTHYPAQ